MSDFVQQNASNVDFSSMGSDSWVILSPIELSIKKKIEAVGVPLKDWDINIYRGVLTGYNEAFIISTDKRNEIVSNCQSEDERQRTEELIRPILRGRDIKRYGYDWAGLYLIATFPSRHYDIDQFPAVKAHLLSFGIERLEQTGKTHIVNGEKIKARKKTNNKWFETQDSISYWDDFSKPKIAWGNLNLSASFSFVENNFFLNAPCPMIVPGTTYLLRMLNSNIVDYCIRNLGVTRNGGYFEYKPMFVSQAKIPLVESLPTDLYTKILCESDENIINKLVAKAFNISDDEYEYIKSKLKPKQK